MNRYKNMTLEMVAIHAQGGSFDDSSRTPTPEPVDDGIADQLIQNFQTLSMNEMAGSSIAAQAVSINPPPSFIPPFSDVLNDVPIVPYAARNESVEEDPPIPALENRGFHLWTDSRWTSNAGPSNASANWSYKPASCYPTESPQTLGNTITFIIEVGSSWTSTNTIEVSVSDEQDMQIPFKIQEDNHLPYSPRYIGTFHAYAPGFYTVKVRHVQLNFQFNGSPFTIPVIRRYHNFWMQPRQFSNLAVNRPWGIAYSPLSRKVYVTERDANHVIIYNESGTAVRGFGGFKGPTGIAVDNCYNRLVIADTENHRICICNLEGEFLYAFGGIGVENGEFNFPLGVSVSSRDGTIAVADAGNTRLQTLSPSGEFLRRYTMIGSPRGVCFDLTGDNIYVTDFNNHCLYIFDIGLTTKTTLVPPIVYPSQPQGIAVDAVGNVLFCDTGNNRIRVLRSTGEQISQIVGGDDNSFMYPQDLVVISTGEVIVVDSNSKISIL